MSVVAEDLKKIYRGGTVGVEKVSFVANKCEVLCLLGPNGAGKTTTIGMLSTIIRPTAGRGYVCGYDIVREARKVREHILLVPQEQALELLLTVEENLIFYGMLLGLSRSEAKDAARRAMELLGLEQYASRRVIDLSGGLQRRVQLAYAFLTHRDVVFLDEPTIMLDHIYRVKVWNLIRELAKRGSAIVMATNELEEAEAVCDRVVFLNKKVLAQGTVKEVKGLVDAIKFEAVMRSRDDIEKLSRVLRDVKGVVDVDTAEDRVKALLDAKVVDVNQLLQEVSRLGLGIVELRVERASLGEIFEALFGKRG